MLLRRNGDRARLRRRDFNHALSATEHYSVSSPGSPVPNAPPNTEKQLDFALPVFDATLDMQPVSESGNVWVVPVDSFRSNQFAPLNLEWDSDDDSVPLQNS